MHHGAESIDVREFTTSGARKRLPDMSRQPHSIHIAEPLVSQSSHTFSYAALIRCCASVFLRLLDQQSFGNGFHVAIFVETKCL